MAFLRWHTEQRNFESTECALCAWKGVKVAESTEYRFGVF